MDDTGTRWTENVQYSTDIHRRPYFAGGHFLGDNWGSEPDEDWIRFELKEDTEYEVSLEGSDRYPVEHRLMRPRITGIYDKDSQLFHEGAAGSGTDPSVTLTFRTADGGEYYLGIGSNPGGRTGVYSYRVLRTGADGVGLAAANNSPTGGPGINSTTGVANVGEELTATTSGIADADGLEDAIFSYQWVRHDPFEYTDTDIPGATGSTYTVTEEDLGQAIKVRVEFTDDAGNYEKLTGYAVFILPPGLGQPHSDTPVTRDTSSLTDEKDSQKPPPTPGNLTATANPDGSVTLRWEAPDDDSVTGYQILRRRPNEGEKTLLVHVNDTGSTATEYTDRDVTPDVLHAYRVKAINPAGLSDWSNFDNATPVQPAEPAQNSPAKGEPTISGTAQVGEKLAADTSGITDTDGLTNVTYSYQWLGDDTDIAGATSSTYTLVDDDEGRTIKVRVIVTDDAENETTLTSEATDAVEAAPQPDSPATGQPTISGTARVGEMLTAETSGITDTDGLTNVTYSYQWLGDDTDIAGATSSTYTLVDDDEGRTIKVRVVVTDDAANETTLTSEATDAVEAAAAARQSGHRATDHQRHGPGG